MAISVANQLWLKSESVEQLLCCIFHLGYEFNKIDSECLHVFSFLRKHIDSEM